MIEESKNPRLSVAFSIIFSVQLRQKGHWSLCDKSTTRAIVTLSKRWCIKEDHHLVIKRILESLLSDLTKKMTSQTSTSSPSYPTANPNHEAWSQHCLGTAQATSSGDRQPLDKLNRLALSVYLIALYGGPKEQADGALPRPQPQCRVGGFGDPQCQQSGLNPLASRVKASPLLFSGP